MSVRSAQSITVEATTRSPSTGAAAAADSLPTGILVLNGVDNAASVTITSVATGRYKLAVTLPTLAIGDIVELIFSATVATVADSAVIWRDTCDLILDASGRVDVAKISGTAQTARDLGASVLLSVGTGAGQVNLAAGKVPATVAAADVSGNPAVNVAQIGGQTASAAAPVAFPASVSSYAGGAVASVTGNVGGNVVGSVASVTGSVGSVASFGTLVADIATAVWSATTRTLSAISDSSGITTLLSRLTNTRSGLLDNLDVTISSRLAAAGYTTPDNAGIATVISNQGTINTNVLSRLATAGYTAPPSALDNAAAVWGAGSRSLTDKAGFSLSQLFPTNFASLAIEVGTGKVTTANPSLEGGGSSLTITDVQTALTNQGYTGTRAAYLDNISAAPPNASAIATAVKAGAAAAWYTAPDNAGISSAVTQATGANTKAGLIQVVTDKLATMLEAAGGLFRFTVASLANAPVGEGTGDGGSGDNDGGGTVDPPDSGGDEETEVNGDLFVLDPFALGESSPAPVAGADWTVRIESGYPRTFDAALADESPFCVEISAKKLGVLQDVRQLTVQGASTVNATTLPSDDHWETLTVEMIPGFTPVYRARLLLGTDTANMLVRNREVCLHIRVRAGGATLDTQKYLITAR